MTEEDMRSIVREAVYETLGGLGVDARQQNETQADFHYIRRMRKGSEAMGRTIRNSFVTVLIPSLLYILWKAVRESVR